MTIGIVLLRAARWNVVDRRWEVREKFAGTFESFFLRIDRVVDRTAAQLYLPTTQFILSKLLAEAFDYRRAGDEER